MSRIRVGLVQRATISLSCICALLTGNIAQGMDISAEFNAGVGVSDNIARASSNEKNETIGVAGIAFGLVEESSRLSANVQSQFDYQYYADGTFDDEWVGGLVATLDFTLIDERLTWLIQDNFGQQTSNTFIPSGPGNREDVNFLTTGPTLNLFPGSRNSVQMDLRYSNVSFEEQNNDNERLSGSLQFGREVRRGAQLSLNLNATGIDFEDGSLSANYDRYEGFARFELAGGRNNFGLDAGYTEIQMTDVTSDGILARLNWTRQVSEDTTFVLSGGTNYSDQGDIFRFNQGNGSDLRDTNDSIPTPAPFTNNFVTASYDIARNRTRVNVGILWSEENYEGGPPVDRIVTGANLRINRDFSLKTYGSLNLQFRRRNFKYLNSADDNVSLFAELGLRFGPASRISLQYSYFERSGDSAISESTENRLFLRFFYSPAWGR